MVMLFVGCVHAPFSSGSTLYRAARASWRLAWPARVQEVLGVADSALDCEIAAWTAALQTQSVSLETPRCVVG